MWIFCDAILWIGVLSKKRVLSTSSHNGAYDICQGMALILYFKCSTSVWKQTITGLDIKFLLINLKICATNMSDFKSVFYMHQLQRWRVLFLCNCSVAVGNSFSHPTQCKEKVKYVYCKGLFYLCQIVMSSTSVNYILICRRRMLQDILPLAK